MSSPLPVPWRSVWLPRALTAVALVIGLPMFLRSSPWCDVTLYQLAARNILHGGTHYSGLFDTNMPGPVWVVTCVQLFFGTSVVALRAVDLLFVLGIVLLIDRLAKWGGASPAARWWAIAAASLYYPFACEMAQAQRDLWMALPALAAVAVRVRRVLCAPPDSPLRRSYLEGLLWGVAVWVKPHIVLMALAVWLLTARRAAGGHARPGRAAWADLAGNLAGGLTAAVPGVIWLICYDAWEPFLDVFLGWNPYYTLLAHRELSFRVESELHWFPPWSLGIILTVPLALASVLDMAFWRRSAGEQGVPGPLGRWLPGWLWEKQASADARFVRGVFCGLYLVWVTQSFLIQRGFLYVHVPETFLMFGVWAMHRWAWACVGMLWLAVTSGIWLAAENNEGVKNWFDGLPAETRERYLPRHPIADPARLKLWPTCWRPDLTERERYKLWDDLRLHPPHEAVIGWEEIAECAEFLRAQGVEDGSEEGLVIGWHDSPHAVYLVMNIKPGVRFIHVYTAISIADSPEISVQVGREQVYRELADARGAKYVISDLEFAASMSRNEHPHHALVGPARNPPHDLLPAVCPSENQFPFNQPTLFRSRNGTGRYIVHRVVTLGDGPIPKPPVGWLDRLWELPRRP